MSSGSYDTAQICRAGHVINTMATRFPAHNQPYCDKCGEATMTTCGLCKAPIRGSYLAPGFLTSSNYPAPAFCYQCGGPYPWTERRLRAARELAEEAEGLDDDEKEM